MNMFNNIELTLFKSSDKNYAVVGDIITYTITATNSTNIILGDLENNPIVISDILPPELKFIKESIYIDCVNLPNFNISEGISIGILNPAQSKSITFKAEVVSYKECSIKNSAIATYSYKIDNLPPLTKICMSNESLLSIEISRLELCKKSHSNFVVLKDIIEYTVTLSNTGTIDAINVLFLDILPKEVVLIDGSFTVDDVLINSVDLFRGINIGNIAVGDHKVIKYKVKVLNPSSSLQITNVAKAKYIYILSDMSTGSMDSITSSDCEHTVNLGITNFKQLNIQEYLHIPSQKPDIEAINIVNSQVDIIKCHVIQTNKTLSSEGQYLSGYKLIIHGLLKVFVEYTACEETQSVHCTSYSIPFSTFIVLPDNYKIGSKLEVEGIVEDIYFKKLDCRSLFTNITILINSKILFCK